MLSASDLSAPRDPERARHERAPRPNGVGEMIFIPGGTFRMGSDRHYPEEAPVHRVTVDGFWIDRAPVTNAQFRKFVNATGYVTFAELRPDPQTIRARCPHAQGGLAGVHAAEAPRRPAQWAQWWNFKFGANWRRPYGPRSSISGLDDHPVVHVAYRDAEAYATGPARNCRPKRSGNSRRAAASTAPSSPGATSSRPAGGKWQIPGRALSRTRTWRPTAMRAPRR